MTEPKGGIPIFGNPLAQKLMRELQDRGMMTGDYFDYVISIMNDDDKLLKNYNAVLEALDKEKGNITLKGDLIKHVFLTSTMGVSYKVKMNKSI